MLIGDTTMDAQKQKITAAVAKRIKYFRNIRGISQEELALNASLNPAYYGQVERGLKCPTIDTLYKIAGALEVSPADFFRSDILPNYISDYSHRIQELLTRIPPNKADRVLKVIEDLIELF